MVSATKILQVQTALVQGMFPPGICDETAEKLFHEQLGTTTGSIGALENQILQLPPDPQMGVLRFTRLASLPIAVLTPSKKEDPRRTENEKGVMVRAWKDLVFGIQFLLSYDRSGPVDYAFNVAVGMWLRNTREEDLISASLKFKRRVERQGDYHRESLWITLDNNRLPDPNGASIEMYWEADERDALPMSETAEFRLKTMESPVGQEVTTNQDDVWRKARNDLLTTHRLLWPSFKPALISSR